MKPFHYHEDPMYAVAAAILADQTVSEEALQEAIQLEEANKFASLLGKLVLHGSPGYPTKEVIASVIPHQTKKGSFEVEFKSGAFDVLSQGELNDLMNGVEVFYKSPHGGRSVIELQEEESVDLEEGVEDIAAAVANFKKGDKTNFGVVTDVSSTSISFKAKDLPVTKIAFNQRKMGSKDFVLDKLVKLKEGVSLEEGVIELQEAVSIRFIDDLIDAANKNQSKNKQLRQGQSMMIALKDMNSKLYSDVTGTDYDPFYNDKKIPALLKHLNPNWKFSDLDEIMKEAMAMGMGMGTATITAPGNKLHGKQVSIFHKFDDGRLNVQYAKSDKKGDVQNLTLQNNQYKLDEAALKQSLPTKENKQRLESFMKKFNALRDAFPDVIFRGTHDEKVETGLIDDGNIVQYLGAKIPLVHRGNKA